MAQSEPGRGELDPWGLDAGDPVWVGGHAATGKHILTQLLTGTVRPPTGTVNAAFVVPKTADEAIYFAEKITARLAIGGMMWLVVASATSKVGDKTHDEFQVFRDHMGRKGFAACDPVLMGDSITVVGFKKPTPVSSRQSV